MSRACSILDKISLIKAQNNLSFEEIILNIQLGNELDIYDHPNQKRYPNQKISVVAVEDYIYLVPYIENNEEIFLKTIISSRKATRQYKGGSNE